MMDHFAFSGSITTERIANRLARLPAARSIFISKADLPTLPPEFVQTRLGTPLWIAHPGSTAQYRATLAIHAYELEDGWKFHRDRFDPHENPLGHFFLDAPELPIALTVGAFAGAKTYQFVDGLSRTEEGEDEGPNWLAVLAGIAAAALVGIATYVVVALIRVAIEGFMELVDSASPSISGVRAASG